ncbi:MAG: hypothetical protein ACFFD2_06655 [Promethearchaeota archaeon]
MKRPEVVNHRGELLLVLEITGEGRSVNMGQIPYDQFKNVICLKDAKELGNYIIHIIYYLSLAF